MSGKPVWRPPEAYVHGVDSPVVVVPARVAAWMHDRLRLGELRSRIRGADSELDSVLLAISVAAHAWRASVTGNGDVAMGPIGTHSGWLSTGEAAQQLSISDRAVRAAIAAERLPATRSGDRWWIAETDVQHYLAAREAKTA